MSNRSLFPEGVEIHQKQMVYESESRQSDAKNIVKHTSRYGVIDGLEVTVNGGDNTKIDVAAGSAYTPDGRKMTLVSAQTGKSITNTLGTVNYVCMVYDEVQSDPEAHRVDASTKMTVASASPRVVVLTESAYNALPLVTTSGMTLSSNARDRIVILARVTGTGVGLVSGDIEMPDEHITALNATQPSNISGVTIIRVGSDTPVGDGTLTYTSGTTSITWAAYGESAGASVPLNSSQTYTVFSSGGSSILIDVGVTLLPVANATDTITVSDIYGGPLFRFSAVDATHRSKIGSGVVSDNNPHGMTLDDLAPGAAGSLEVHQDVMHANGIGKGSSASILDVTIDTVPTTHTLSVAQLTGSDSIYINGRRITSIATSLSPASPTDANPATYQLSITQDGELNFTPLVQMAGTYFADKIQVLDVVGVPSGTYELRYSTSGLIEFGSGGIFGAKTAQMPSVDGLVRAYFTNGLAYVDLWVKSALPGATTTETLTVTQIDPGENFVFATVPWSGSANGDLGYGFGTANAPNGVFYKRSRGTLDVDCVRTDSGIANSTQIQKDLMSDGLLYETNLYHGHTNNQITFATAQSTQHVVTPAYPNTIYTGGACVVGGRRFNVSRTSISLLDNVTNKIFITSDGSIQLSPQSWAEISALMENRPYLPIYEIPVASTVVGTTVDLRTFTGYKRDSELGVVGLDANKEATITPVQSGNRTALRAYGYGSGSGVNGYTHASAPDGTAAINGIAQGTNNTGVWGVGTGDRYGVIGQNASNSGVGVRGEASGATGGVGVSGVAAGTLGVGVYGSSPFIGGSFASTGNSSFAISASPRGSDSTGVSVDLTQPSLTGAATGIDIVAVGKTSATGITIEMDDGINSAIHATVGSARFDAGDVFVDTGYNYRYTSTRTGYKYVMAPEFQEYNTNATDVALIDGGIDGIGYWGSSATVATNFVAKVHMPVNATITGVSIRWFNNSPGSQSITINARMWTHVSGASVSPFTSALSESSSETIASPGLNWVWSPELVLGTPQVYTQDSVFFVSVSLPIVAGSPAQVRFCGMRVSYTYNINYGVIV